MSETAVTAEEILDILPHRFPFLLVDKVVSVQEGGDEIVALKNVSWGEPYFQGHFPKTPVMPGVLMVEAMAQTAGILAAKNEAFDVKKQLVVFMTIDKVKFRRQVVPGDQLIMKVEALRKGKIWKLRGEATVDGEVACQAEFLAGIVDRE